MLTSFNAAPVTLPNVVVTVTRRRERASSASMPAPTSMRMRRRLRAYTGGMPGPMKRDDDESGDDEKETIEGLRAERARLESELAIERTAKTMLENQLRACVSEVSKILAAKRELEMELRDATQSREGDE